MASGDEYFAAGKYDDAAIQYANAVAKAPRLGEAHMRLAEAYMSAGNTRKAFPQFIAAADLMPDNLEAQLRAGHMLLKGGLFTESKNRARVVLQRDPKNINALLLLGNSLGGLTNLEEAIGVLERAVVLGPERVELYTNLGVFELAHGDAEQAEITFQKAVTVSNGAPDALVGLGNFYRVVKRYPEAERVLRRVVEEAPKHVGANQTLAALYLEMNRLPEAEPYLKAVTAISNDAGAQIALANYYVSAGRFDEAIKTLDDLAQVSAHYADAKRQVALVQFQMGQRQQARATIDEVLGREPRNGAALAMKARLLLADGQPNEALTAAKAAVTFNSQAAESHLTLGRVYLVLNDREEARKAFRDALVADPDSLPAHLELIELHRQRRELDLALRFADDAIKDHPQNLAVRIARLKVLSMRDDERPRAAEDARGLLAKYPTSSAVHSAVGAYYLNLGNSVGARQEFQRAADLDPSSLEALTGLVTIDIGNKDVTNARARVEAQLAKTPASLPLLLLAAKIHHVAGDLRKAEETLRRAMKADPIDPQAYGLLASLYVSQGRIPEAKKEFTELARLDPRWVGAPTMLGVLAYSTRNFDDAKEWWEKAIAIDPNTAAASNNLAWLLVETNGNLERALQLALVAKSKLPDQPEVNDTLGWIYYKMDMTSQAVQSLLACTEADPKNVMYQFHLGMVYAKAGEDAKAGRALKMALSLDPKFAGAELAKKTLALLVY